MKLDAVTTTFFTLTISVTIIRGSPLKDEDEHVNTICTHDGVFHADDALGCYMLKILHPKTKIVRSRDSIIHENCDILFDVGGVYNPEQNRFDHHQQNFSETMSTLSSTIKSPIRLSSAGLIYHHFGRTVLKKMIGEIEENALDYVYRQLYYLFIVEIDGIDNGIEQCETEASYNVRTGLSSRLGRLNQPSIGATEAWNDTVQFDKAMTIAGEEFIENVKIILEQKFPVREIVRKAIENRYIVHSSGQILELDRHYPWKNHFFEIEELYGIQPQIMYVLFPEEDKYRIRCIPPKRRSYGCRKTFPESWWGLRNEVLSKKAGIENCTFVHMSGFTGGNEQRNGALEMAIKSLIYEESTA